MVGGEGGGEVVENHPHNRSICLVRSPLMKSLFIWTIFFRVKDSGSEPDRCSEGKGSTPINRTKIRQQQPTLK